MVTIDEHKSLSDGTQTKLPGGLRHCLHNDSRVTHQRSIRFCVSTKLLKDSETSTLAHLQPCFGPSSTPSSAHCEIIKNFERQSSISI